MKYRSTRGGVSGLSFKEALYSAYVADGGILMPESLPSISRETLLSWKDLSYKELAKTIFAYFIPEDEMPASDLHALLDKAFSSFSHEQIVPVVRLKTGLNVLELWHGATWSFKDLAMSCIGQFLEYFLAQRKEHVTVLVATSGDTGSAAIEAVRGLRWLDIIVMFPKGRVSEVQEQQMTTALEENVHVIRVEGTNDDCDNVIKPVFLDTEYAKEHKLCSINSINWARIMVQSVHYFYLYLQLSPLCVEEVEIIVPTGACGNVTSGLLARQMGLPIKLSCAVNRNDIFHRTVTSGDFSAAREVMLTLSQAMDIQVPYNMERIWYLVSGGDCELVGRLMREFEPHQALRVPEDLANKIRQLIVSTSVVTDEKILETMRRVSEENDGYLICPHTATAIHHLHHNTARAALRGVVSTASVVKFEGAVREAGITMSQPVVVKELLERPSKCEEMRRGEDWGKLLREKIEEVGRRQQLLRDHATV